MRKLNQMESFHRCYWPKHNSHQQLCKMNSILGKYWDATFFRFTLTSIYPSRAFWFSEKYDSFLILNSHHIFVAENVSVNMRNIKNSSKLRIKISTPVFWRSKQKDQTVCHRKTISKALQKLKQNHKIERNYPQLQVNTE